MNNLKFLCLRRDLSSRRCMGGKTLLKNLLMRSICSLWCQVHVVVFSGLWIRPEVPQQRKCILTVHTKRMIPSHSFIQLASLIGTSCFAPLQRPKAAINPVKLGLWLQCIGRKTQSMQVAETWC